MPAILLGRHTVSRVLRSVTVAGMVCAAMASQTATAAPADPGAIQQLLAQDKVNEAAKVLQAQLKQNPEDVQLRFLQGVVAAEQKKYDQAIKHFSSLTQDYPALPEPYNNLAVLYAAKGDERKAAQVLEQAIRTNPSYATAHENLGDLYARMASDAYAKALQLDNDRQAAKPKLSLIQQIYPAAISSAKANVKAAPAAPVVNTATKPAPALAATVQPEPPVVVAANTFTPPQPAVGAPVLESAEPRKKPIAPIAVAIEPAKVEKAEPKKLDDTAHHQAAVEKAVHAWAKAWSQQNMAAYYAAYSDKFDAQGSSFSAWKAERKDRIVGKPEITVDVQNLKISIQGDRATANFRQYYASGGYKATTRKVLRLQREGERWRIIREETGR